MNLKRYNEKIIYKLDVYKYLFQIQEKCSGIYCDANKIENSRLFLVESRNETFHKGSANGSRTLIDTGRVY